MKLDKSKRGWAAIARRISDRKIRIRMILKGLMDLKFPGRAKNFFKDQKFFLETSE